MGQIVGAALVSHHPGLMQCEEFRVMMGNGADSDLIAGYRRIRAQIDAVQPDVLMIFDTHWFTTGYHLIDGGEHYCGKYLSDEMPWYLFGAPYDYRGCPELARLVEEVARERKVQSRAIYDAELPRHYATINIVSKLARGERIVSVSSCQNCRPEHYLQSGAVIAEAIRRSGLRVVLLASGALSHRFNQIDWTPKNPRIFHESNVSAPENAASDKQAIELLCQGRHDQVLDRWAGEYRKVFWEAFGAHYLQMVGALGGRDCRAMGTPLSEYENARGTGNIHIWFDVAAQEAVI
ncbi:MAG: extradiol ring-cleavage dioxygenase [Nevskia sp.]|nr:extradiol ring-cleavage dioxygenase [Nevskia sp.]